VVERTIAALYKKVTYANTNRWHALSRQNPWLRILRGVPLDYIKSNLSFIKENIISRKSQMDNAKRWHTYIHTSTSIKMEMKTMVDETKIRNWPINYSSHIRLWLVDFLFLQSYPYRLLYDDDDDDDAFKMVSYRTADWDWITFWPIDAKLTKLILSFDWLNYNTILMCSSIQVSLEGSQAVSTIFRI